MKIGTDVTSLYPRTARDIKSRGGQRPGAGAPAAGGITDLQFIQSMTTRLQAERTLGGALTIAVMSRNIIHKAMEVSARLRSIASQAMMSGRIDADEVGRAVAEINTALGNYGEGGVMPVRPAADMVPEVPDISGDINTLREIASTMRGGVNPDYAVLDNLDRGLSEKLEVTDSSIRQIQDSLTQVVSMYRVDDEIVPEDTAGRVIIELTRDPASAIRVQGNVSRDSAARLLMS